VKKVYALVSLAVLAAGCSQSATAPSHLSGVPFTPQPATITQGTTPVPAVVPILPAPGITCRHDAPTVRAEMTPQVTSTRSYVTLDLEWGENPAAPQIFIWYWNRDGGDTGRRGGKFDTKNSDGTHDRKFEVEPRSYNFEVYYELNSGCGPNRLSNKTTGSVGGSAPAAAAVVPPLACQTNPGAPNLHCEAKG
jgi:hypothetical protein